MANWFNNAVVYEIYPQSFNDTNGDGIGDLRGITEKLDYIKDMGFNVIWLNPICESPMRDAGYDITDFYKVDKRYGTNEDYRALCDAAHERGMKVMFDIVPGHTSVDHPWFQKSAMAEENEYTDRYVWTDDTFDNEEGVKGYSERNGNYITNFFWHQPALNYGYANPDPAKPWQLPLDHPACLANREELRKIFDFWIDLGTDAFRVDMAATLIKRDWDRKNVTALWTEMREYISSKNPDCLLVSEWGSPAKAINAGFHLDFLLHDTHSAYTSLFRHENGRNTTKLYIGHSYFSKDGGGFLNEYLDCFMGHLNATKGKGYIGHITGNHDIPRISLGRDADEIKTAMAFLFTMPGVPFVYYGDEIGMAYNKDILSKEGGYNRTGSRTPMQWDDTKNHGFSISDTPYLPTDSSPAAPTVAAQIADGNSILNCVKALAKIHREYSALWADGEFNVITSGYPFIFERFADGKRLLIAINPSDAEYSNKIPKLAKILLSQNAKVDGDTLTLGGVSFIIAEEI